MANVRTTGREFIAYWNDADYWLEAYIEDDVIRVNGEAQVDGNGFDIEKVVESDLVEVVSGVVITPNGRKDISLTTHLRKWLKNRNTTVIMLEVGCDKRDALLAEITAAIIANGGKVVKK